MLGEGLPERTRSPDSVEALERLQYLTEELGVRIWETDADLRITYVDGNQPAADGLTLDKVAGKSLVELHENTEHLCAYENYLTRLRAHEPFKSFEYMRHMPDGSPVYISMSGTPLFAEGGAFRGYRGIARNITQEVEARHNSLCMGPAEESKLLKEAIGTVEDGFAIFDANDRLLVFNEAYRQLYGAIVKAGVSFRELYADAHRRSLIRDPDGHIAHWKQRRMARTPQKLPPIEQQLSDGRWIRVTSARMSDGGSVEIRSDITALKERERALAESEGRFHRLFSSAPTGIALTELDGRFLEVNPAFCEIAGLTSAELLESDVYALVHPDEHEEIREQRRRAKARQGDDFKGERRIVKADGSIGWLFNRMAIIRDATGEPANVILMSEDITARRKAEERLRESEALLRIAGRTARLGGWTVDLPGHRIHWSDEVCRLHEVPPGTEIRAKDVLDFVAPEDRQRFRESYFACVKRGMPFDDELQIVTATGRRLWARVIANAVREEDGEIVRIQGSFQDVTERRETLEQVHSLAERLSAILESITDGFIAVGPDWKLIYVNAAQEHLAGRSREELIGMSFWAVFPHHATNEVGESLRQAMRENRPVAFQTQSAVSGKWLDINAYPSEEGLSIFARDVTETVELEQQLAHSARLASMGEMAASLAHEINQPLSVINMATEGATMELEEHVPDLAYVGARLAAVLAQIGKLRELIDHIRGFARQDNGKATPFDPAEAIASAARLLEHSYENEQIALIVDIPVSCVPVLGFPLRLEQVIVNLLTNARDAVLEQAAREADAPREVRLAVANEPDCLTIRISDTGGGIPPEVREKLFEPFFTTKDPGNGTGLGLSIVHSIITGMNGRIEVSNIEQGCAFAVTLPGVVNSAAPTAAHGAATHADG